MCVCGCVFRGPFSTIRRCVRHGTNEQYAVKIIDVAKLTSSPGLSIDGEPGIAIFKREIIVDTQLHWFIKIMKKVPWVCSKIVINLFIHSFIHFSALYL